MTARARSSAANSFSRPPKFSGRPDGQPGGFKGSPRDRTGPPDTVGRARWMLQDLCVPRGRGPRDAPTVGSNQSGRPVDLLGELSAAVEHVGLDLGHLERLLQVRLGEIGVESLARENVDADEVLLRKRMDAD